MENYIENTELLQMREQLSVLKDKLEKETIVNDKLMRRAMKAKVSSINREKRIMQIIGTLAIPYFIFVFKMLIDVSWWFIGATDAFLLFALIYTYVEYKDVRANDLMSEDLLVVRNKILRTKRMNASWLRFGIPFLIIWIVWFIFETIHLPSSEAILIGGCIGIIFGLIFGIQSYRKTQRQLSEVIQQIEEFTAEQ